MLIGVSWGWLGLFNRRQIEAIKPVATILFGMCYLIEAEEQQAQLGTHWSYTLTFHEYLFDIDIPHHLHIFLSSEETWYGLVFNEWPYKDHLFHGDDEVEFNPQKRVDIGLAETLVSFIQEKKDISPSKCFAKLLNDLDCQFPCFPIIFNGVNSTLPACKTFSELWCVMKNVWGTRKIEFIECLKMDRFTLFEATFSQKRAVEISQTRHMDFFFYVGSDMRKIEEEIYTINLSSFIGSMGGALGLFFGFSILQFCSSLIATILHRRIPMCSKSKVHPVQFVKSSPESTVHF